jgi:2-phosphoglycerate kinase
MSTLRVILIGGPSNIGKSTLAEFLATELGWRYISTDRLARHPGRPWKTKPETVPAHVADHYLSLSVDELFDAVLRHYRSMWPTIESIVTMHATECSADRLIMEGSALWPESVATLNLPHVAALWLTASNNLLQERIYNASQFGEATAREKMMIQKFLERAYRYNQHMMEAVNRLGLVSINIEAISSLDELSDICLEFAGKQL